MELCWCTITVKDMDASVKFYREIAGLPLNRRFKAGPGVEICFLGDGETKIELICRPEQKAAGNAGGVSLGFEVDSLEGMLEFVKGKGLAVASGPFQPDARIKFFYVKDPDGVSVQFVENL